MSEGRRSPGGTGASTFARTLVDEWARAGVAHACLAPGSRSTPLALALAAERRISLHVHLDERSAAFFALGAARASGRPAVALCTSGTAAANFHPAVIEARHGRVSLIVCTADRPPELRDTGAGQAVDQLKLYGDAPRWFCEVGVADQPETAAAGPYWRSVGARAVVEATGPPAGPVHLNLAFREPLVSVADEPLPPGRPGADPWVAAVPVEAAPNPADVEGLRQAVAAAPRGLVLCGWGAGAAPATVERFAAAAGWPILADPLSNLRAGPLAVSTYDALLRLPAFAGRHRPELVLRIGAPPTSKVLGEWLDPSVYSIVVDPDRSWLDPHRSASRVIFARPGPLLDAVTPGIRRHGGGEWLATWLDADRRARKAIDDLLDRWAVDAFEGRVARDLFAGLPDGATLVVGSSMPVRDLEAFAAPRQGVTVLANRGANGIDGFVSTVLGVAAATPGPVVALCGDLTMLHDVNGFLGASRRRADAVFVVVDNNGGGIFSFLPQASLGAAFEPLFLTPHHLDLREVAAAYGVAARAVPVAAQLAPAIESALAAGGVQVLVVPSDRDRNVRRHAEAWAAVAAAVTT